jgi:hypothetical protein
MWKYSNQIAIRWVYFMLAIFGLAVMTWVISGSNPELLTQTGLKAELTGISVQAEFQPLWVWPIVFFAITILMLTGIPSLLPFAVLIIVSGFYPAFTITCLCQIFVTRICIHRAWKIADSDSYQNSVRPGLKSLLWQNQENFMKFAFWGRVYFAYPLRSIDYLTPMIQPDEKHLGSTLIPAAAAILLRMLIPSLWLHSLLRLAVNVAPNPASDVSRFLLWSSALVAYTMMPRIPEFFFCHESVRPILSEIDRPSAASRETKSANSLPDASADKNGESEKASVRATAQQAIESS